MIEPAEKDGLPRIPGEQPKDKAATRARPTSGRDIAATNADEIGPALDTLIELLQDLRRDLPDGDRLTDVFTDAAAGARSLKQ